AGGAAVPGCPGDGDLSGYVRSAAYDNRRQRVVSGVAADLCARRLRAASIGPTRRSAPTIGNRHMKKLNRRDFVRTTAVAGVAAATPRALFGQAPTVMTPKSGKPVVVAAANGNKYKNGGTQTCVAKAFDMITGGADVLDAV